MDSGKIADAYDAYYYAHGCGSPYGRTEEWLRHFNAIAERISSRRVSPAMASVGVLGLLDISER